MALLALALFLLTATVVSGGDARGPADEEPRGRREPTRKPWIDMNYGPYLTAGLEVEKGNIACKGIAIRLDEGEGGVSGGNEFVLFDTDTLRYAAGWLGPGFINWKSIVFDGSHQTHPSIVGQRVFSNPVAPGWGRSGDGGFEDQRVLGKDGRYYGPLPRDRAHWKGLYLHGGKVVLSYTVGDVKVLELPGSEGEQLRALTRTIRVGPRAQDLILQVAHEEGSKPELRAFENPRSPNQQLAMLGMTKVTLVAQVGGPQGSRWITTSDGHLRLKIPAGSNSTKLKLLFARVARDNGTEPFVELVRSASSATAIEPLTRGGPARWREKLVTEASTLGPADGPYVTETLAVPMNNPYRSWMRIGGFDFFEDGRRAAVCTWMGDVWTVDGLDGDLGKLTWQRIATGLFQGLGLKVVDGAIYVLGRDQITRLHDLNGDGETDFYENFNNDAQVTEHFHEFAMALQTDAQGNFYYAKGGRHALDSVVPQHGTLLRVAKDGSRTEIIANGFRAPNGLCINPDGSFLTSDQEGHWTPANRINWVRPGGFYGYMWSYLRGERPTAYDGPLCWIPPKVDRSPAEQLWVTSDRWGPVEGQLISLSYGTGYIDLVLHEKVKGKMQGGVVRMPIGIFPTGIMRGRFHPGDGQLYLCGLFGWSGNRSFPGGFYRVRYSGKPVPVPLELHATEAGMVLRFSEPLEHGRAGDPRRYAVERWNYNWREQYGSKDYRVSDGEIGRDKVVVKSVRVAGDGRSVLVEIPDMKPCMQMRISYRLLTAGGARLSQEIHNTVHVLGDVESYLELFR